MLPFRRPVPAVVTALPLICLASAARADGVVLPYGAWIAEYGPTVASWAVAGASALISALVAAYVPWARSLVTQERLQQAGNALAQYGINAVANATKDGKVTVEAGPQVIAEAVKRGIDVLPKRVIKAAQGPEGLAAVIFRNLPLVEAASKENVLAPFLDGLRRGADPK
jgi:hypothetical protein